MDQLLLPDQSSYLAENSVRSLTTPTFIPSVVYSAIGGILTFALFDKYTRKDYFLPYLYFGTTALSYSFAHIFLIIFVEEEKQQLIQSIDENDKDITHVNALYGSVIIAAVGSYFAIIALIRLLEVWIRVGLQRNLHLSKYYLGILTALLSAIPFIFSLSGDIILIKESNNDDEMMKQVRKALILKLIGATCNIVLVLFYLSLCLSYAFSAFTSNIAEKSCLKSSTSVLSTEKKEQVEKTFRETIIMLLVLGFLALARFIYDLYVVAVVIKTGPFWDVYTYLVLVVVDGIAFLVVAFLLDLSQVKELVVYEKIKPTNYSKKRNITIASQNVEEIIPLSRSPIHMEEYR